MNSFYESAVKVFKHSIKECEKLDDAMSKCKEYEPFVYPPTNRKIYFVYVSEKSHIAITADKWEKTEDCLLFYQDEKVIAFFNTSNIFGMCESTTPDICITKL